MSSPNLNQGDFALEKDGRSESSNPFFQNGTEILAPSETDANFTPKDLALYKQHFNDNMQNKPVKHDKAYALLVSWHTDIDDLNVKSEFDILETFLNRVYGFKVRREQLGREKPNHQLNQILSSFMYECDEKDSLLIIYYGGHARNENEIHLAGSASQNNPHNLVWSKAEQNISGAQGDILVVFDCCYAGSFGGTKVRASRPNFEFLAACGEQEVAAVPGKTSFTTAFMWAMKDFKEREEYPFTSRQLVDRIKTRFMDENTQTPELQVRDPQACGSIWITPQNLSTPIQERVASQGEHRRAHHEYIDLRLNFYRKLEPVDAANVAKHLTRLVRDEDDFAKEITLINVSNPTADIVSHWRKQARRGLKRKSGSSEFSLSSNSVLEGTTCTGTPTICVSPGTDDIGKYKNSVPKLGAPTLGVLYGGRSARERPQGS
ncbi:hypothetical protein DM02DRAFT_727909 [Periconia macrospinosa]|uniref:Peptidase C14 n=1 Tax=Periconia macrospinosa TaxID=97972 RepID=A0A2V1DTC9_9PLEO|nr:hypothetical protein DM02DRAFT_727909 [Periconia macrospinosa]